MLINSAMNEGLAGMQQSQKRLQQTAEDIVKAGVPTDHSSPDAVGAGRASRTNNGTAVDDISPEQSVGALLRAEPPSGPTISRSGDITGPLIEQQRQQLLFDASANVVKVANQTLGSLIDDLS